MDIKYSVVVPVYKNEDSIPRLIKTLMSVANNLDGSMEAIFVVDGSPDQSFRLIRLALEGISFPVQLLVHSRNFGSFAAIRSGLAAAEGKYVGVIAADLQEPPELLQQFFFELDSGDFDVVIGSREIREDSFFSALTSKFFWWGYRRFVVPEIPEGGVDVFGCNRMFLQQLLELQESRSSLVSLIFWLGYRRKEIPYKRLKRMEGKSSWSFKKKLEYLGDSIFAFTDLPIRILTAIGLVGILASILLGILIILAKMTGGIEVTGYTATILAILSLGSLNLLGLGLVGNYAWRTYENSKLRPLAVVSMIHKSAHYDPE